MSERRSLASCPGDDALLDAALGVLAPSLAAHLVGCPACHRTFAEYRQVAGVARTALARRVPALRIVAAAAVLLIATLVLTPSTSRFAAPAEQLLSVFPHSGADVRLASPYVARIAGGTSTFVLNDPRSVVETPFGPISCARTCEFTVEIEPDHCGTRMPPSFEGVRMTVRVIDGHVEASPVVADAGLSRAAEATMLARGHALTLPYDRWQ
jgi:hypothetical protein